MPHPQRMERWQMLKVSAVDITVTETVTSGSLVSCRSIKILKEGVKVHKTSPHPARCPVLFQMLPPLSQGLARLWLELACAHPCGLCWDTVGFTCLCRPPWAVLRPHWQRGAPLSRSDPHAHGSHWLPQKTLAHCTKSPPRLPGNHELIPC